MTLHPYRILKISSTYLKTLRSHFQPGCHFLVFKNSGLGLPIAVNFSLTVYSKRQIWAWILKRFKWRRPSSESNQGTYAPGQGFKINSSQFILYRNKIYWIQGILSFKELPYIKEKIFKTHFMLYISLLPPTTFPLSLFSFQSPEVEKHRKIRGGWIPRS